MNSLNETLLKKKLFVKILSAISSFIQIFPVLQKISNKFFESRRFVWKIMIYGNFPL